jgi:putative CocE/NonD family hydrolase
MDRYVRGLDNGVDREPAVRAFLMGENVWREAERWPIPGTASRVLFLTGATAGRAGGLRGRPSESPDASTSFVSDPAQPVEDPYAAEAGAHDYRRLPLREDLAVFETVPFPGDLRVVGPIGAEIHVSTEAARDLDVWVKLFDVAPDGTAFNLMSPGLDVVRASYRNRRAERELLDPGRVYGLRLANLMTGNTFRKGHRLRLVVCGSFFPHFSRNLQTGELETTSKVSRPARVSVHHSARYASHLVLPVVAP